MYISSVIFDIIFDTNLGIIDEYFDIFIITDFLDIIYWIEINRYQTIIVSLLHNLIDFRQFLFFSTHIVYRVHRI